MTDPLDFTGRIVAVTGGAMGFGRAIARSFSARGAKVFATDVDAAGLAETAGDHPMTVRAFDLTDRALAAGWIAEVEAATGRAIDILVNNAGGMRGQRGKPVEQVTDTEWDSIFDLNVDAGFATIRAAAPAMKRAGQGRIVNLASGAAFKPSRTRIQAYCSAKHAVLGLTRQMAMELGPFGITMGRLGAAQDIADAVMFFASPLAGFVTGQMLPVNGGSF